MKENCKCPFCETELKSSCLEPVFCKPCSIKLVKCKKCGKLISDNLKKCPHCSEAM